MISQEGLFSSALLVEDEPNLAIALEIALKKLLIPTQRAMTLKTARDFLDRKGIEHFDFVLLDRNLPDGDGLSLCTSLRQQGYRGCILILTAIGQLEARVTGLNEGADDYLAKPFAWNEFEARVRALARRQTYAPLPSSNPVAAGGARTEPSPLGWAVDINRLRVQGPRGWVELTPLEFKLASRLIEARGTIVTRDSLLKDVWGFTLLPKTRTVDHFLGRLRKHFEKNPEDPKHFLTVRGAGYRFEP